MVFSSQAFLFVFLPVTFLLYSIIPSLKIKNVLLILASLLFYAYGEAYAVFLMIFSIIANHVFALAVNRNSHKKLFLWVAVVYNIGVLFIFKYLSWIVNGIAGEQVLNIELPIGISFFTFQLLSYVIDVYRGDTPVQKNLFNTMLYCSFFPQLIAGPIVKYHDVALQIENRKQTADKIISGIKRFIIGLFKKIVISDSLAVLADFAFNHNSKSELSALSVAFCAVCYSMQIYFDFCGYSEMAIGLGRMFGFEFLENFNYPFISSSIKEFWRRWHISLSTWFKEYVYIPLGGNRKGKARTCVNKGIVFLLTGIWHGANLTFIVWGIIHGFFILLEESKFGNFIRKHKWLGHIYTLMIVVLAFVVFRADSINDAGLLINRLFVGWGSDFASSTKVLLSQLSPYYILVFVFAVMLSTPVIRSAALKLKNKSSTAYNVLSAVSLAAVFGYTLIAALSSTYSPFIYFQF